MWEKHLDNKKDKTKDVTAIYSLNKVFKKECFTWDD